MSEKTQKIKNSTRGKRWLDMKSAVKELPYKIGRNQLFKFLREKHILNPDNSPKEEYLLKGYFFQVQKNKPVRIDGIESYLTVTLVSREGLEYIAQLFKKSPK